MPFYKLNSVLTASVIAFLLFADIGLTATLIVPDNYTTIQSAINAAASEDVVIVRDGIYTGTDNKNLLIDKAITLRSENGASSCVIDCENDGRGIDIRDEVTVYGITIRNGNQAGDYGIGAGGGIYCFAPNRTIFISDCIIQNNEAEKEGGGIYITYSNVMIESCIIEGNRTSFTNGYNGGGIDAQHSTVQISRCVIKSNQAGGEKGANGGGINIDYQKENTYVVNSLIYENVASKHGGAISNWPSDTTNPMEVINCTIINNDAEGIVEPSYASGGIFSIFYPMKVYNCIIYGNSSHQIYDYDSDNSEVKYSNVEGGYSGEGNIDALPYFVDENNGNFRLLEQSSCIDTANSDFSPAEDIEGTSRPLGNGWDMGAYESTHINIPPEIDSTFPEDGSASIDPNVTIWVFFTDPMDENSINSSTFTLVLNGTPVSGTVGYDGEKATFKSNNDLQSGETYTATVKSGVSDNAGNNLLSDFQWSFKTIESSSPDDEDGGEDNGGDDGGDNGGDDGGDNGGDDGGDDGDDDGGDSGGGCFISNLF